MKKICLLGASGSIGDSTLKVIRQNPEQYRVHSVVAQKNVNKMFAICAEFSPLFAVMEDERAAHQLREKINFEGIKTEVLSGEAAINEIVAIDEIDIVVAAIVGAKGFLSSLAAVRAGKTILLANKETLVMGGALFMNEVKKYNATILPIDSEHNAIFQCLPKDNLGKIMLAGVEKLILTASGGPFRTFTLEQMSTITKAQALKHPNWNMGAKVTIDSSTLMNKGLEFIEAHFLFGMLSTQIEVVVHPQSIIHSLVQYKDGSFLAQLGEADMAVPIAHALGYPKRINSGAKFIDLTEIATLTFEKPDVDRFPCLQLAIDAIDLGNRHLVTLNAANEVLVDAFLKDQIGYTHIAELIEEQLNSIKERPIESIEELIEYDLEVRQNTQQILGAFLAPDKRSIEKR